MFLSVLILLTALCISSVAAYYSMIGLVAIFPMAFWPIILMSGTLEVGKVLTTVWLHKYWERSAWYTRTYLSSAVVVLMMLTSMGIFGFLSKAHMDQAVPTGDVAAQVQLIDDKIQQQRDIIATSKTALAQMDAQVNELLGRTTDAQGANRAVQVRKQQAKDRNQLNSDIAKAQTEITKLQNDKAPVAAKLRKVEAEVGPIKYIAALIYGESASQDILERAVRFVIIMIVLVFDPLAIMLILAATQSLDWTREDKARRKYEHVDEFGLPIIPDDSIPLMPTVHEAADAAVEFVQNSSNEELHEALGITVGSAAAEQLLDTIENPPAPSSELIAYAEQLGYRPPAVLEEQPPSGTLTDPAVAAMAAEAVFRDRPAYFDKVNAELNELPQEEHEFIPVTEEHAWTNEDYDALVESVIEKDELIANAVAVIEDMERKLADSNTEVLRLQGNFNQLETVALENEYNLNNQIVNSEQEKEDLVKALTEQVAYSEKLEADILEQQTYIAELLELNSAKDINLDEETEVPENAETRIQAVDIPVATLQPEADVITEEPSVQPSVTQEETQEDVQDKVRAQVIEMPDGTMRLVEASVTPAIIDVPGHEPIVDTSPDYDAGFGTEFPQNPVKGKLFLRVDQLPSKLYKWNGRKWIEVDKSITDSIAYNKQYIDHLIEKLANGEYTLDDLSEAEKEQVQEQLNRENNLGE